MAKGVQDANTYRIGHPLAQRVLGLAQQLAPKPAQATFDLTGSGKNVTILNPLVGKGGWLACYRVTMSALETEEVLIFGATTDDGTVLDDAQSRRLFDLPANSAPCAQPTEDALSMLDQLAATRRAAVLEDMAAKNAHWFDAEMDKLDHWSQDRQTALRAELDQVDADLRERKRTARTAPNLPEKLEAQRQVRTLEAKRADAWRVYDEASRAVERQKDDVLDEIGHRLEQQAQTDRLFVLQWLVK